ncbi:hypothetical protein P280DRAFT_521327 [Massarina eburnea CBS 473.64]|uniref:Uncharacterized protein n=1 Tax=Massarina eburnea CBS 473.64 TaxID=1395130 RepID=A0A6A6RS05_9PLEO|nr:hypothetical protein P280DRAFT_521327 [Massarina eburnea CBS 473.64]
MANLNSSPRQTSNNNAPLGRLPAEILRAIGLELLLLSKEHAPFLIDEHQQATPLSCKVVHSDDDDDDDDDDDHEGSPFEVYVHDDDGGQKDLASLTLVCRTLVPIAQELKFRTTVVKAADLAKFTECLWELPHLGPFVRNLRIELPKAPEPPAFQEDPDSVPMYQYDLVGKLLQHLPQLRQLSLTHGAPWDHVDRYYYKERCEYYASACFDLLSQLIDQDLTEEPDPKALLLSIPAFAKLDFLAFRLLYPPNMRSLRHLPKLRTLDITPDPYRFDIQVDRDSPDYITDAWEPDLTNVQHLRWNCQWFSMSDGGRSSLSISFRRALVNVEQIPKHFSHVKTLDMYGDPASRKSLLPLSHDDEPRESMVTLGDLVARLVELGPTLEKWKVPGGVWIKIPLVDVPLPDFPFPEFQEFEKLSTLIAPQAAFATILEYTHDRPELDDEGNLIGQIREIREQSFTASFESLPPNLRVLRIFDADDLIFDYLYDLFDSEAVSNLKIKVLFNPTWAEENLEPLRNCKLDGHEEFWNEADSAGFTITVGIDDGTPVTERLDEEEDEYLDEEEDE